jgi:hypothetical protein
MSEETPSQKSGSVDRQPPKFEASFVALPKAAPPEKRRVQDSEERWAVIGWTEGLE